MTLPAFDHYFGVDFSGAKRAGDFIWVAEVVPHHGLFELTALRPLTAISGSADREIALPALVRLVRASDPSHGSWMGVDTVFLEASAITLRQNRQQHAKMVAGRRRAYFPFAV